MLNIKVIASGSSGNCTLIQSSSAENILLDAGVPYVKIAKAADFKPIDFALITHEHNDHANKSTIKTLLERGVEVYMTAGTRNALKFENRHNLHALKYQFNSKAIKIGSCKFKPLEVIHDAAEPVAFQLEDVDDRILYATDAKAVPYSADVFTKMIVETNFGEETLLASQVDDYQKRRIWENHVSFERVFEHFDVMKRCNELANLKELHLIHISARHGDGTEFKKSLAKLLGEIPIYTH